MQWVPSYLIFFPSVDVNLTPPHNPQPLNSSISDYKCRDKAKLAIGSVGTFPYGRPFSLWSALLNGPQAFFCVCRERWPLQLKRWCDRVKHNLVSAWRWMGKKEEWSRKGEERRDERRWLKMPSNAENHSGKPTRSLWRHRQVSQRKVIHRICIMSKAQC